MKIKLIITLFCLIANSSFAQSDDPTIPKTGVVASSFVPKGWKIILQSSGDLNKDGLKDLAIVIENTNPNNFKKNEGMGQKNLNLNPRMLLVLFKSGENEYRLASTSNNNFIPSANDEESTCLADPLLQDGGINIEKGLLKVQFQYFYSCGSWYITGKDYTFRFQNQQFELIGYDDHDIHRSSGEHSMTSINFSTKKRSDTFGGNEFDDAKDKPKTTWKAIRIAKLPNLATISEEMMEKILR